MSDQVILTLPRERYAEDAAGAFFEGDQFLARIGPFHGGELRAELEGDPGDGVSLQRLLDAVVDSYEVSERNDGAWIELSKRIERTA